MFSRARSLSRRWSKRNTPIRSRTPRRLKCESLEDRQLLSATPYDAGPMVETYSDENFFAAAMEYAQLASEWGTYQDGNSGVMVEYFAESETTYEPHLAVSRYDFSFVVYTPLNEAPEADAGGEYSITEGDGLTLDGTGSTDADGDELTYSWDVNGDGVFGDAEGATPTLSPEELEALGIADDGTWNVTLEVTDGYGGVAQAETTLTVSNALPSAQIAPTGDVAAAGAVNVEGTPIELGGLVTDPGTADTHTLSWQVSRDGELYAEGSGDSFTFTPDDNGSYNVTLTAVDDDGGVGQAASTIEVVNADPVAVIVGAPESSPEGTEIALGSQVTDPGTADTHTLSWQVIRDGEVYAEGEGDSFTFTPDDNGRYTVTLTAIDDDGGVSEVSSAIDVTNVDPKAGIAGAPESTPEGTEIALAGEVSDPGTADTHELAWQVTREGELYAEGAGKAFAFTPDDNGTYVVNLTATDDDGGVGTASQEIEVTNVAPTLESLSDPELAAEGETVTLAGTFSDPGKADTFSVEVDWGDGTTDTIDQPAGSTGFEAAHAYQEGGVYAVAVSVADDDGGRDGGGATAMVTGAGVHDGTLQVVGTQGDDHAFVGQLADGRFIVTSDVLPEAWQPRLYDPAGINQVEMVLLGGDDLGVIAGNVHTPGVLRGGDGSDRLVGGSGNDVILGGAGDDLVAGVRGRDLIVGGTGGDLLVGTMGEDILASGTTAYDANDDALSAIMAEWTSEGTLAQRRANLSGTGEGGLNGDYYLAAADGDAGPATVFDDGARDALFGGPGADWFFASSQSDRPEEARDRVIDATLADWLMELPA